MKYYIVLKNLEVIRANAMQCAWVYGTPSLTQWGGFINKLKRDIDTLPTDMKININGFNVSYYDYHIIGEIVNNSKVVFHYARNYHQMSDKKSESKFEKRISARPQPKIDLFCSLLICCDINNYQPSRKDEFVNIVYNLLLRNNRICAGDFVNLSDIVIFSESEKRKIGRYLMPGNLMVDRTNLLIEESAKIKDRMYGNLDDLMEYLWITYNTDKDKFEKYKKGWFAPLMIGWNFIGKPTYQIQGHEEDDVRYSEPMVTLIEYVMSYKFKDIDSVLWRYNVTNNNVYFAQ
jgi:hypothetical protein